MHTNFCFQVCLIVVGLLCLTCDGSIKAGKGKIESFNGNRFTEAKSISSSSSSQDGLKTIFTATRNRVRPAPPAHDTPASSCSCRKWCQCQCHCLVADDMIEQMPPPRDLDIIGQIHWARERGKNCQYKNSTHRRSWQLASSSSSLPYGLCKLTLNFFFHQYELTTLYFLVEPSLTALIAKVFQSIESLSQLVKSILDENFMPKIKSKASDVTAWWCSWADLSRKTRRERHLILSPVAFFMSGSIVYLIKLAHLHLWVIAIAYLSLISLFTHKSKDVVNATMRRELSVGA